MLDQFSGLSLREYLSVVDRAATAVRGMLVRGTPVAYHGATPYLGGGRMVATLCSQCDKPESKCTCDKYCCFCQSLYYIRLCIDGLYYCPDCREACDIRLAESDER